MQASVRQVEGFCFPAWLGSGNFNLPGYLGQTRQGGHTQAGSNQEGEQPEPGAIRHIVVLPHAASGAMGIFWPRSMEPGKTPALCVSR